MADQRVTRAAALLKSHVASDIALLVQRDAAFLKAVCTELGLTGTVEHLVHVGTMLHLMGVPTGEEYPKHIPNAAAPGGFIVVNNEDEEEKVRAMLKPVQGVTARTASAGAPASAAAPDVQPQPMQAPETPPSGSTPPPDAPDLSKQVDAVLNAPPPSNGDK